MVRVAWGNDPLRIPGMLKAEEKPATLRILEKEA